MTGLDWQFAVVTLAALLGAWLLLRPLLPPRLGGRRQAAGTGACGRCSSPGCGTEPAAAGPGLVKIGGSRGPAPGRPGPARLSDRS